MAMECGDGPPTTQQLAEMAARYPEDEFPQLRGAEACAGEDFFGADFEFGIRALVRGLVLSAQPGSAGQKLPTTSGPPRS